MADERAKPIAKGAISLEDLLKPIPKEKEDVLKEIASSHQELIREIIDRYEIASDDEREAIRRISDRYDSFSWVVGYQMKGIDSQELRRAFVYLSILDQLNDTRDFLLRIRDLIALAKRHGIDYRSIIRSVGDISSDVDRYQWGTTRQIFYNEG